MDMQDKEFDEAFRSKLEGFDVEPSAKVWLGITGGLKSAKRRATLQPWLSIAAGIVVLIGLSILFIPKKTDTHTALPVKNPVAKLVQPVKAVHSVVLPLVRPSVIPVLPFKTKKNLEITRYRDTKPANLNVPKNADTAGSPAKVLNNADRQLMADVPRQPANLKPVVPDKAIPLTLNPGFDQLPAPGIKPDKLASQTRTDHQNDSVLVRQRHKIRNFGDLVNVVVDKLDKRKDKVVQFADDEDGDSHLTGVNLGIVKIKKGE